MLEIYQKNLIISPSIADSNGKMSYPAAFDIFMDMAAEHAEFLGLGFEAMAANNRFWLTVKTKILYYRRPKMAEQVTVSTWLEPPEKIRCNRCYDIQDNGEVLAAGKTEWAVIDTVSHTLVPIALVYPNGLKYEKEPPFTDHFSRIPDSFDASDTLEEYRVRSTDIDVGKHMNNAAYLRAAFGAFSCSELQKKEIKSIDAVFRKSAYEGDVLLLQKKTTENGLDLRYSMEGETVFLARIEL